MESEVGIMAPQAPFNTKSTHTTLQPGSLPPIIEIPFQLLLASLGTTDTADSVTIASNSIVSTYTSGFRHATLSSLSLSIHPTLNAPSYPTTVQVVWVPSNSAATTSDILNVFGGQCFCIGGALQSTNPINIPCNLTNFNPIIKDSVTYLDTPKLLFKSLAQATPPTVATCYLTLQGTIKLHSPLLQTSQ